MSSEKEQFLGTYEREHQITMRLLRAYPTDKLDLRPHPKCKTAKELAWVFAIERGLGTRVFHDEFATAPPSGKPPEPPESWEAQLAAVEQAHKDFRQLIQSTPDDDLMGKVKFFTAPKTMGDITRLELLWFLLSDEIHHRGQFSVYSRMAGGKVPSIYGPTADEPWM